LRVKDLEEADAMYRVLLPALGFPKRYIEKDGAVSYDSLREHPKPEFIAIIPDPAHVPNKTRLAFWCDSNEEVDEFARVLAQVPARNVEGPAYCLEYSPAYYAVFFEDPSGNCLEVCCRVAKPA
jgi:catechol 2,3-dioxygenase-like lactoylglutathione lyase family enzyme